MLLRIARYNMIMEIIIRDKSQSHAAIISDNVCFYHHLSKPCCKTLNIPNIKFSDLLNSNFYAKLGPKKNVYFVFECEISYAQCISLRISKSHFNLGPLTCRGNALLHGTNLFWHGCNKFQILGPRIVDYKGIFCVLQHVYIEKYISVHDHNDV